MSRYNNERTLPYQVPNTPRLGKLRLYDNWVCGIACMVKQTREAKQHTCMSSTEQHMQKRILLW